MAKHDQKNFARVVRALRTVRAMTQEQLAQAAGISVRTVRAIEAEDSNPRVGLATSILDALQASPADRASAMGAE